jgi:hypothetical protein
LNCRDCLSTCPAHYESTMPPEERLCNNCIGRWAGGGGTPGNLQHDPSRGFFNTIDSYGNGLSINIQNTGILVAGVMMRPHENVPHEKMASRIMRGVIRSANTSQEPETPVRRSIESPVSPSKAYIQEVRSPTFWTCYYLSVLLCVVLAILTAACPCIANY